MYMAGIPMQSCDESTLKYVQWCHYRSFCFLLGGVMLKDLIIFFFSFSLTGKVSVIRPYNFLQDITQGTRTLIKVH